jgi:homopolymeric O-antigen transport system permease protein
VAYSLEAVPANLEPVFLANPLAWLMELWRFSMLGTPFPPTWQLIGAIVVSLGVFLAGAIVFQRNERSFADLI